MKMPKGATPLSREDLKGLIPKLATRAELDEWEQENIAEALVWAQRSRSLKKNLLSASGLYLLHNRMFNKTWTWAGKLRTREVLPVGCSPSEIQNQLGSLLGDIRYWIDEGKLSADEIAVRFHHRLVLIHPFPNGNGRFSRLAADLFLMQRKEAPFSWSSAKLDKTGAEREKYIKALQTADKDLDNYGPLLHFARA